MDITSSWNAQVCHEINISELMNSKMYCSSHYKRVYFGRNDINQNVKSIYIQHWLSNKLSEASILVLHLKSINISAHFIGHGDIIHVLI